MNWLCHELLLSQHELNCLFMHRQVQFMSRKTQFMKSQISIRAVRQFIEKTTCFNKSFFLVEAAGVFSAFYPSKSSITLRTKSAKKRHFHPLTPTHAQSHFSCFNFFRRFFGDFNAANHPLSGRGCLQ